MCDRLHQLSGASLFCANARGEGAAGCGLEAHRQPYAVAAGVVAEHIAGHQPGAGDEDIVLAAVELHPEAEGVEGVEAEQAALLAQVFGAGSSIT